MRSLYCKDGWIIARHYSPNSLAIGAVGVPRQKHPKTKRLHLFWIIAVMNEPGPQSYYRLEDWFVYHALVAEQIKAPVFIFVLAHVQA